MDEMEDLLNEWEKLVLTESDHFVRDGVISQPHWDDANIKILFLLKETNGYKKSINKLINFAIHNKSRIWRGANFNNLGRWAYALQNLPETKTPFEIAHKNRKTALLNCAFINLKKTSGGRTATKKVEIEAEKYASLLKRQIEMIDPNIIVFGGTYKVAKQHVLPEMYKVSERIHKYKDIICINAFHPACTTNRKKIYDQVIENYYAYLSTAKV